MVVVDTNIIIDQLRRPKGTESALIKIIKKESEKNLAMSIISIQELFQGQSSKDNSKQQILLATISPLEILPYTYEVAQLAGEIARDLPRSIELADAAIAATAILNGCLLLTLDKKDFMGIKDISFFE